MNYANYYVIYEYYYYLLFNLDALIFYNRLSYKNRTMKFNNSVRVTQVE